MVNINTCRKCGRVTYCGEYCYDCFDSSKHEFVVDIVNTQNLKKIFEFEEVVEE